MKANFETGREVDEDLEIYMDLQWEIDQRFTSSQQLWYKRYQLNNSKFN